MLFNASFSGPDRVETVAVARVRRESDGVNVGRLSVLGVTRPNFLVLTPVCLALGVAVAWVSGEAVDWPSLAVILLGGVMAHASVNALNEYADFRSGLDFKTQRTPFSGGSGTLVKQPQLAARALLIGAGSYLVTLACGLYLVWRAGWGLVPLGLLGLLLIYLYDGPISRNRYLVLLAPGLGFGPLMVLGTYYGLTGSFSYTALLASLVPFFLVNSLLLLNQVPDVEADRGVGRDNFAIALGPDGSAMLYGGTLLLAYLALCLGVLVGLLPPMALLGLLTAMLGYQVFREARACSGDVERLLPALAKNVLLTLATPLLVAAGIGIDAI